MLFLNMETGTLCRSVTSSTETFVSGASRHSDFGRGDWLKDIRSVDTTQISDWVLSNYFYREMSTLMRWLLLPFLLLASALITIHFFFFCSVGTVRRLASDLDDGTTGITTLGNRVDVVFEIEKYVYTSQVDAGATREQGATSPRAPPSQTYDSEQ